MFTTAKKQQQQQQQQQIKIGRKIVVEPEKPIVNQINFFLGITTTTTTKRKNAKAQSCIE